MKNTILYRLIEGLCLFAGLALAGCSDSVDKSDLFTFKGETVYSYLEKSSDYSDFAYILSRVRQSGQSESTLSQLLSARGNYTVFAPTNKAVHAFVDSVYMTHDYDLTQIEDTIARYIALNAVIDNHDGNPYQYGDFVVGTLERPNMEDRYISIDFTTGKNDLAEVIVNRNSKVVQLDIETSNGYVHGVNRVLDLSASTLPALIETASNLHIFSTLLKHTGWASRMTAVRDEDYEVNHLEQGTDMYGRAVDCPPHRYIGFTAFVETDSVYVQNGFPAPKLVNNILQNEEEIVAYAKEKCRELYPFATSQDLKSEDNAVNQFVAYHLLPERLVWDKLVIHYVELGYGFSNPYKLGIDCHEYYETLGSQRRLMKLTEGAQSDGKRINRHCTYNLDDYSELEVDRAGILIHNANGNELNDAVNGIYYPISELLWYDDGVPGVVLNERLRWDIAALLPELMTCGYRRQSNQDQLFFPNNFFENLRFVEASECRYLPYYNFGVDNWQGDEFNLRGNFDLTLKLPPVPNAGTYELRFAAPSNNNFGMAQFYFGKDPNNLPAIGLPVDLRVHIDEPQIGWKAESENEDENIENDKVMRCNGYLKPPMHDGIPNGGGAPIENMRDTKAYQRNLRLRKIIWTGEMKPQDVCYIRVKNLLKNTQACFLLDYMEWCPKHIYQGIEPEDKW